jgi:dihydrofolate synthase/folylpolyglutamate synthase
LGRHQAINAAVAIESAKILREMGWAVREEDLVYGISNTKWSGRFEILRDKPLLVIDGAHNAQGIQALNHARKQIFKSDYRVVVGVLGEKELGTDFVEILQDAKAIWTATPDNPRALSASELTVRLLEQGIESEAKGNLEALIDLILREPSPCLIFGSLYLIGPVGNALKRRLKDDSCSDC